MNVGGIDVVSTCRQLLHNILRFFCQAPKKENRQHDCAAHDKYRESDT